MIIDSHVHIFPETLILNRKNFLDKDLTFRTLFSNNNAKMVTAEDLIFNMDKESIDISVILSMGWQDLGIVREVNDYIIDSVKRYPDRLIGFAGVNPLHANAAANEIELHAQASDWNDVLWLISTALKETGGGYSGEEYASLRNNLPVTFH